MITIATLTFFVGVGAANFLKIQQIAYRRLPRFCSFKTSAHRLQRFVMRLWKLVTLDFDDAAQCLDIGRQVFAQRLYKSRASATLGSSDERSCAHTDTIFVSERDGVEPQARL